MDIRATRMLLESLEALTENESDSMRDAFNIPGIGDYIRYGFEDAQTPQELVSELTGLYKYIESSARSGDISVAKDYDIADVGTLYKFLQFVKQVELDPEYFFNAYKQTSAPITEAINKSRYLEILNKAARRCTGLVQERAIKNINKYLRK